MHKHLSLIFLLGFSSGLPLALVGSTLQAWFATAGLPVKTITLLSLIHLPYLYRIVWGPLLDYFTPFSLGKRRSWIVIMQIVLLLGFILLSWLSPLTETYWMAALALLLACFSAAQDVAIDAHRIEYLPPSKHGLGASLAVFGYRTALMISGGLALVIAEHYGFSTTYRLMSIFIVVGIIAILISKEPSHPPLKKTSFSKACTLPLIEFFKRPGIGWIFCFIIFYKFGEAFTATTSSVVTPFLIQGLGFSLEIIGYFNKILGIVSILIGGLFAGILLLRWPLYRSLLIFGLIQVSANLLFIVLAIKGKNLSLLALAVIFDNIASGMTTTALVTFFMRMPHVGYVATQFSLLTAVSTIPRILSGPLTSLIQPYFGWVGVYQFSFFLALGFLPLLIKVRRLTNIDSTG